MESSKQKIATCPKSPNHRTFKEEVRIEGIAWSILDDTLATFETEAPHEYRIVRRSSRKLCAIDGAEAIVHLPF